MTSANKKRLIIAGIIAVAISIPVGVTYYIISKDSNSDIINVDSKGNEAKIKTIISNVKAKVARKSNTNTPKPAGSASVAGDGLSKIRNATLAKAQAKASEVQLTGDAYNKAYASRGWDAAYAVKVAKDYYDSDESTTLDLLPFKNSSFLVYIVYVTVNGVPNSYRSVYLIDQLDGTIYDIWSNTI